MRLLLAVIIAHFTFGVVKCEQGNASASLLSVLSAIPTVSETSGYLSSYPDWVAEVSQLQNVTFLAPVNSAWNDCFNTSEIAGENNFLQLLFNYHTLYGNITQFGSDAIVSTNLRSSSYTNVTGGAVVKYFYDSDYVLSGLDFTSGLGLVSVRFHTKCNI